MEAVTRNLIEIKIQVSYSYLRATKYATGSWLSRWFILPGINLDPLSLYKYKQINYIVEDNAGLKKGYNLILMGFKIHGWSYYYKVD